MSLCDELTMKLHVAFTAYGASYTVEWHSLLDCALNKYMEPSAYSSISNHTIKNITTGQTSASKGRRRGDGALSFDGQLY